MVSADRISDLPRWRAAAGDLPGDEPPAPPQHWRRYVVGVAAYALASVAYAAAYMTPNTSWEHHPFAGPLVAIYESRHPAEFAVAHAVWAGLGAGLCGPAFRPAVAAAAASAASAAAWVALGVWATGVASC